MSARATISLGALATNYRALCAASPNTTVTAVVKANGYGLGATEVAKRLRAEGCGIFYVATAREGVALRRDLGLDAVVRVLEGAHEDTVASLVEHGLVPVLNTPAQFAAWAPTGRSALVHVDTGMRRLGLPFEQAAEVIAAGGVEVEMLVSHFARADEPEHSFNAVQLKRVDAVVAALARRGFDLPISMGNSAGILAHLGTANEARAGVALYGGHPFATGDNPMMPVLRLDGRVLQVCVVPAGEPIGYGGAHVAKAAMRIATVGAGYADGVPRLLSGRGRVYVGGAFCPIVGRISMDMLQVDVGPAEAGAKVEAKVEEGDWAEVLGANVTLDEVAGHAQTLGYEILTSLGARAARVYQEALLVG